MVGTHTFYLEVDGIGSNEPTNWSLADVQFSVTTSGLKDLCVSFQSAEHRRLVRRAGSFCSFREGDRARRTYDTYIVLFNRYGRDAKVYVSTFKDTIDSPIMVATGQLVGKEIIPSDGRLVITAGDIQSFLSGQGISWNPLDGVPGEIQHPRSFPGRDDHYHRVFCGEGEQLAWAPQPM